VWFGEELFGVGEKFSPGAGAFEVKMIRSGWPNSAEQDKFLTVEIGFGFLDGNGAFANGGVAMAEEHGGDLLEGLHVFGLFPAGEGELKSGLFEELDRGLGEQGLAGSGAFEDLGGGLLGIGSVVEVVLGRGAGGEALEGGFVDRAVECFGDAVNGFAVAKFVEPDIDLVELVLGEAVELGEVGFHGFILFWRCKWLRVYGLGEIFFKRYGENDQLAKSQSPRNEQGAKHAMDPKGGGAAERGATTNGRIGTARMNAG
jgi:hypothetical protein